MRSAVCRTLRPNFSNSALPAPPMGLSTPSMWMLPVNCPVPVPPPIW